MICLDSTFIIDFMRNEEAAVKKAASFGSHILFTTQVNVFELLFGELSEKEVMRKRLLSLQSFLDRINILNLDRESAMKSAEIAANLSKKGRPIGHLDSIIAGIALTNGVNAILTRNVKDFSKIKELNVIAY